MATTKKGQRWVTGSSTDAAETSPGLSRKILAYCDEVMCVENTFVKGASGPMHSHPHTQITYVAEGKFAFTIEGEERIVVKGDAMLKQDGVEHGCVCLEDGVLIDLFAPMREDFI